MSSETKSEDKIPHATRYEYTNNNRDVDVQVDDSTTKLIENDKKPGKRKITIEVDEDDPCLKEKEKEEEKAAKKINIPGLDPRFQQQNQTLRCWVMYTDFYRCKKILGDGSDACTWFKEVFSTMCPNDWIDRWDQYRTEGRFAWHKYQTQGKFPGDKYGV